MPIDRKTIDEIDNGLSGKIRDILDQAVQIVVETKERGGKVVVALGSGPNLHEGVTTLIAELMRKGIIDGVSTSSAVINHEMAGTLEKVKRVEGIRFGIDETRLPSDGFFEVALISKKRLEEINRYIPFDTAFYWKIRQSRANTVIKVAGNVAFPTGLYTERIAREVLILCKQHGVPFELMAGFGADPRTMIGTGAELDIPVIVTVPQLTGGGEVGLCVGDSISVSERSHRLAELLDSADVIIESAIALSQEIHDGPFERFTGHGIWTDWEGGWTYSLSRKKIIRIDLDRHLEMAWSNERESSSVTKAVHSGMPKTKSMGIPFRMEMSGFARIPGSLPVVGDIGEIWPVLAARVAERLQVKLDFMSYKQSLPAGEKMREWIVKHIEPLNRERMIQSAAGLKRHPGYYSGHRL